MNSGALTSAQVQTSIMNDVYTTNYVNPVIREYQAAFGRVPDAAGASYWANAVAAGTQSLGTLATTFANSAEFQSRFGATGTTTANSALVSALYTNVYGRAPDAAGLAYWVGSGLTAAQLLNAFANATEFVTATAGAVSAYQAAEIAGTAPTTGSLFNLGGTLNAGTTYALTSGVDTLVGGVGNDVFQATDNTGGTSNWGALDTIDGGAGTDTLNVASGAAINTPAGATIKNVEVANLVNTSGGIGSTTTLDTTGWTGLTTLNTTEAAAVATALKVGTSTNVTSTATLAGSIAIEGGNNVTATSAGGAVTIGGASKTSPAGTITVSETSTSSTGTVAIDGGSSVSVTQTGANFALASTTDITIGANAQTTGAITVNATSASSSGKIGAISVKGGSTVTITEAAGDTVKSSSTGTDTMGNVTVTGTTATTSVSVTQAAAATATDSKAAVTGVVSVSAVAAAPGTNAVTAVTGVTPVAAVAGSVGVTNGTVNIADKVAPSSTSVTDAGTSGGTISSVTLSSYGASSISSPALSTLSLSGTGGTLGLYEGGTSASTNTTLTLNVNNLSGTNTITDNSAQFTTLNIVAGATKSTLTGFTDTSLKTINLSGSSVVTVTNATSATSIKVTGAAGYAGTLNDTTTTFDASGTTGANKITISADATKAITGGSGTGDEIVLGAAGSTFTAAKTGAKVTGFEILGLTSSSSAVDASVFGSGINKIDVTGTSVSSALTNVNSGTAITLSSAAKTTTTTLSVAYSDVNGANDATTVTFAGNSDSAYDSGAAQGFASLTLADANGNGVGTLNIVDNNPAFNYNSDVISTLVDAGLTTLNFSGTGGLQIGGSAFNNSATSMTIGNTGTNVAGLTVSMVDNALGSLTLTGSGKTTVTLSDSVAGTLAVTNSGTGSVVFNGGTLSATKVNLTGAMTATFIDDNIASIAFADGQNVSFTDGKTSGVTVSAAADNSHLTLSLTGASATNTDTITVGNANNSITDGSSAGTVNVTVGTGSNLIDLHTGSASTYLANVTLGTHTSSGPDKILVGKVAAGATTANTVITGAVAGDLIQFVDTGTSVVTLSSTQLANIATNGSLAGAIQAADLLLTSAHSAAAFVYGGNTYVIESNAIGNGTLTANDALIELIGTHTLGSVTSGVYTLAS